MISTETAQHWRWILIAKGVGITLVVVGHFSPAVAPPWWKEMVQVIYTFHMPLFFVLSGYLYVFGKQTWSELIRAKIKRLLYPFVSVALIYGVLKFAAGMVVDLDHPLDAEAIRDLLVNPAASFVPLLWFVHALFFMFVLFAPLRLALRTSAAVFVLLVVLNVLWTSEYEGLNRILVNFPFFVGGIWLRESNALQPVRQRNWAPIAVASAVMFIVLYVSVFDGSSDGVLRELARLGLGLLGTTVVVAVCIPVEEAASRVVVALATAGFYSMTIYLLHSVFESGVRVLALQIADVPNSFFVPVAVVAIAVGLVVPALLEKCVLREFWVTRKFVLGLDRAQEPPAGRADSANIMTG